MTRLTQRQKLRWHRDIDLLNLKILTKVVVNEIVEIKPKQFKSFGILKSG